MCSFALLVNIYVEGIFRIALENCKIGININDIPVSNIRLAEHTAKTANSSVELQTTMDKLN